MSFIQRLLNLLPHDTITIHGQPYLTRYYLTGKPTQKLGERPGLRIHHFHASDQDRELHNHPWSGVSLVLKGGYIEERREPREYIKVPVKDEGGTMYEVVEVYFTTHKLCLPGAVNVLRKDTFHRATLIDHVKGCWTLFYTGRRNQSWGFWSKETKKFTSHEECTR